ncbi:hypothetical protein FIBSPDRAFT_938657 [Athelia psychrophila]|uniref:Uncharacterized protein n=1 Tax=Athelia psychrophila TaxID=1759441 RepID=A0A165XXM8_9AGAM|nr:hypothetical protein FIBSPDRAFT_938657 [Fibularhizoctonia sp. CBS 109695]
MAITATVPESSSPSTRDTARPDLVILVCPVFAPVQKIQCHIREAEEKKIVESNEREKEGKKGLKASGHDPAPRRANTSAHAPAVALASPPPSSRQDGPTARGLPYTVQIPGRAYTGVGTALAVKYPKVRQLYLDRQNLAVAGSTAALESDDGREDLGPQIRWKTVFLIEYAGSLFIHTAFYHLLKLVYVQDVQHSQLQKVVYAFVMIHFVKRELETPFDHRFSHGTSPITDPARRITTLAPGLSSPPPPAASPPPRARPTSRAPSARTPTSSGPTPTSSSLLACNGPSF